jgi:hypothetical protein
MCLVTFATFVSFALKFHFIPQGTVISAGTANEAFFAPENAERTESATKHPGFLRDPPSLEVHFLNIANALPALTRVDQRIKLIKY